MLQAQHHSNRYDENRKVASMSQDASRCAEILCSITAIYDPQLQQHSANQLAEQCLLVTGSRMSVSVFVLLALFCLLRLFWPDRCCNPAAAPRHYESKIYMMTACLKALKLCTRTQRPDSKHVWFYVVRQMLDTPRTDRYWMLKASSIFKVDVLWFWANEHSKEALNLIIEWLGHSQYFITQQAHFVQWARLPESYLRKLFLMLFNGIWQVRLLLAWVSIC